MMIKKKITLSNSRQRYCWPMTQIEMKVTVQRLMLMRTGSRLFCEGQSLNMKIIYIHTYTDILI